MDKSKFQKLFLFELAFKPIVAIPAMLGLTCLIFGGLLSKLLLAGIGLVSILLATGFFLTNFILGENSKVAKRVAEKLHKETEEEFDRQIEDLRYRLLADGDPRTQRALDDLKTMLEIIKDSECDNHIFISQIINGADLLFQGCIDSLEKTLDLYELSSRLRSDTKKKIEQKREDIVEDVLKSVDQMSNIIEQIHDAKDDATVREASSNIDIQLRAMEKTRKLLQSWNPESLDETGEEYLRQSN